MEQAVTRPQASLHGETLVDSSNQLGLPDDRPHFSSSMGEGVARNILDPSPCSITSAVEAITNSDRAHYSIDDAIAEVLRQRGYKV